MASIDQDAPSYNLSGALIFCAYVISALILSVYIISSLTSRYLHPSRASQDGEIGNHKSLLIFSAFAALSFSTLSYHMSNYLIVSYQTWAVGRGYEVSQRLLGENGILALEKSIPLRIWQWLTTSTLFQDFAQTICGNSAHFWWTQQALFVTMACSVFMSFEGRRRKMPNLWAYALISQILPVSFGQNLFYLDILLTPIPMPNEIIWGPTPFLQNRNLATYSGLVFLAPYAASTRALIPVVLVIRLLLCCPLVLQMYVPGSWGWDYLNIRDRSTAYISSFRIVGACAVILFFFQTAVALRDHGPGEILGSINDSPAVSALGYDYLLSLVSAFTWVNLVGSDLD